MSNYQLVMNINTFHKLSCIDSVKELFDGGPDRRSTPIKNQIDCFFELKREQAHQPSRFLKIFSIFSNDNPDFTKGSKKMVLEPRCSTSTELVEQTLLKQREDIKFIVRKIDQICGTLTRNKRKVIYDHYVSYILYQMSWGCMVNMAIQIYDCQDDDLFALDEILRLHCKRDYVQPKGVIRKRVLEWLDWIEESE
jgi:hypothetical protein